MRLKELVNQAAKVYNLSNGTIKIVDTLQKADTTHLHNAILALEGKTDNGSFTKNLTDILIYAVKAKQKTIDSRIAIEEIKKLKKIGLPLVQATSWFNVISKSPDAKCEPEYIKFVDSVCDYIQHFIATPKNTIEYKQNDLLQNKIKLLEDALTEKNKLLEEKESELILIKEKYLRAIHSESEETAQIIIRCLWSELKFEKAYADVSSLFDTQYKDSINEFNEIYKKLSGIFTRTFQGEKDEKHEMDYAELNSKTSQLIEKYSQKKTSHVFGVSSLFVWPYVNQASPAVRFCSSANKILHFMTSADFQKLPTEINMRDFGNYLAGAKICLQQNEPKLRTFTPPFPFSAVK